MKCYVLDTNVLIQTQASMDVFEENQIVIPLVVVEELDRLKTAEGEKGANARKAIRRLENLCQTGNLLEGVMLENGGSLRIEKTLLMCSFRLSFLIIWQITGFCKYASD